MADCGFWLRGWDLNHTVLHFLCGENAAVGSAALTVHRTVIHSRLSAPSYKADLRQGATVEYVSCEPTESARELFDEDCEPVEEEQ